MKIHGKIRLKKPDFKAITAKVMTVVMIASTAISPFATATPAYAAGTPSGTCYVQRTSSIIWYGGGGLGTYMREMTADGQSNAGYCVEPSKRGDFDGTFTTTDINSPTGRSEEVRKQLWFCYGAPGFDASMWPSTWYDGSSMDAQKYTVLSHILLADTWGSDFDTAVYGTTASFRDYVSYNILGYGNTGTDYNENSTAHQMARRFGEVPNENSFKAYEVFTGSSTQHMVSFLYYPKGKVKIKKTSSNASVTDGNACYSLAGAEFTLYDSNGTPATTLTIDGNGDSNTAEILTGTYTVKETKTPDGYYAASDFTVTVSAGETTTFTVSDNPYTDPIAMLVGKYDGQKTYNGEKNLPEGSASLAGAEFTVDYYDTFDYGDYDSLTKAGVKPTRSWTFATDENGLVNFTSAYLVSGDAFYYDGRGNPCIPRGTIVVRETKAPAGYLKNDDVSFQKVMEGNISTLKSYNASKVAEQVYRSDIEFTKKAENGSERLANVAFKVTSKTTGESHIVVTDENGYFSSASSWNAHTRNTNGNDWALTATGTIDSSKLDSTSGVFFGLNDDGTTLKADDGKGALPYDTYEIEELRCTNNEGYALVSTTVTVSRDAKTIDLGTLDDPEPEIHTTAYDAADSDKYVGVGTVKVSDKVEYSHVVAGKSYTVTGELRDAETGEAIEVNGKAVTATKSFTATKSSGSVTVDFTFDTYDLAGKTVVVYETLTDAGGSKLAEHKDKGDVSQQVTVLKPEVGTTASDTYDGDKLVTAEGDVSVTDTVHYRGLTVGETYTVTGILHEKVEGEDGEVTEKEFKDADGNPVTATVTFTAETENGDVDVVFTFNAAGVTDGTKLVAFESVTYNGRELCAHADIEDEDQTVTVKQPEIGTTAVDGSDSDKNLIGEDDATVIDTVHYKNLTPGKTYKVTGTLYKKAYKDGEVTEEVVKDEDGNPVTAETEFTPEDTYGDVDVTFNFDASAFNAGDSLVAFESVTYNGDELCAHADIEDEDQTVTVIKPTIGTTAKDGFDGDKNVIADTDATVIDTVHYSNVTPGKTYKVTGTLYEKVEGEDGEVTEKAVTDADGNPVTAETEFTPEDTYGDVDVTFNFDASGIADKSSVVAFESLSYKDKEISVHADIEDEDQTVTVHTPEIGTTATDKLDGDKNVIADAESTVTDEVAYDHVLSGNAYTMAGILMDSETGLPVLTGEGAKKYSEDDLKAFVSGLLDVLGFTPTTFTVKVDGKAWGEGAEIVRNADGSYTYDASTFTENEDGTWKSVTDEQTLTPQADGSWKLTGTTGTCHGDTETSKSNTRPLDEKTYKADEVEVTESDIDWSCTDELPIANVDMGKLSAFAEENKELLSCIVCKTSEFVPEKESGTLGMDFTFNSNDVIDRLSGETKNLVVFEVLFKGSVENASEKTPVSIVASECDKDNEEQTVKLIPSTIGTTATDKSDGDHELMAGKDAVITDEVAYEGLIPGKEYTLHATLMDKKTGEALKVNDKAVTAELKFTPNSESGTVSIDLGEFDATSLDGHTLVVFEELTKQSDIDGTPTDVTVAEHKDIDDENQSVTVTSTPKGSTYGKTGVDLTGIALMVGILLILAGGSVLYGIKARKALTASDGEDTPENTEE